MVRMKKSKKQKQIVTVVMAGEHTKTDWVQLREQKLTLCVLARSAVLNPSIINDLDGIISLIDHIQDSAELQLGSEAVFGKK